MAINRNRKRRKDKTHLCNTVYNKNKPKTILICKVSKSHHSIEIISEISRLLIYICYCLTTLICKNEYYIIKELRNISSYFGIFASFI